MPFPERHTYHSRIGFLGQEGEEQPFSPQDYNLWLYPHDTRVDKPVNVYRVYKIDGARDAVLLCLVKATCARIALGAVANRIMCSATWTQVPPGLACFQSHVVVTLSPGGNNRYRGTEPFDERKPAYLYYLGSFDFVVQKV
jgi:hypothetical protein